jgi:shikimate dehydrogenase
MSLNDLPCPIPAENPAGIFALFGNPVAQSLSPLMHNAAYARMGIRAQYRAIRLDDAAEATRMIRELGLRGASVTIPFKESVMAFLDEVEESAREIGAVNTIAHRAGRLKGYNTDGPGLARDLEEWIGIRGKTFAVLGAGGAARAAVHALLKGGGLPVVFSRTAERSASVAASFGCAWAPLAELPQARADVLINTTPVGMFPDTDRTPLNGEHLSHFPQVMDMIYNPCRTRLLREAEAAGCRVRSGVGMFVHQGAEQIRLWTGQEPPREEMRAVVISSLRIVLSCGT